MNGGKAKTENQRRYRDVFIAKIGDKNNLSLLLQKSFVNSIDDFVYFIKNFVYLIDKVLTLE